MGIIECFSKSLYDFKAYGKMKNNSPGKVVLYLFLIACLFGGISGIKASMDFRKVNDKIIEQIESVNPKLENGVLSFEGDNTAKEFQFENYKIVIDPSDKSGLDKLDGVRYGAILGSKEVKVKNDLTDTTTQTYTQLDKNLANETIEKSKILDLISLIFRIAIPAIFILNFLSNFLGGFLLALFIACILLAVSSVMKAELRFGEVYKISIYILTPIYLINTVLIFIGMSISFYFQVLIGLIFGFVIIKSIIQDRLV